jgi:hypothetical protein
MDATKDCQHKKETPIFDKVISGELTEPSTEFFMIPVRWQKSGPFCWAETLPNNGPGETVAMLKELKDGKWKWTGKDLVFDDLETAKSEVQRILNINKQNNVCSF